MWFDTKANECNQTKPNLFVPAPRVPKLTNTNTRALARKNTAPNSNITATTQQIAHAMKMTTRVLVNTPCGASSFSLCGWVYVPPIGATERAPCMATLEEAAANTKIV
jgi:hypothetical protein